MGKIPCDMIKDLLPLYEDDICSERSKSEIEEHLIGCEDCRKYYNAIHEKLPPVTLSANREESTSSKIQETDSSSTEELQFLKKVCRKLNRRHRITIITCGILILAILTLSVMNEDTIINERLRKFPIFDDRINTKNIEITELYQLENGDIYVTIESEQPFSLVSYEISPPNEKVPFWQPYDDGIAILSLRQRTWHTLFDLSVSFKKASFVLSQKQILNSDDGLVVHGCSQLYLDGKEEKQLLIWKEGQPLENAPDTIEKIVQDERNREIYDDVMPDSSSDSNDSQELTEEYQIFIFNETL